MRPPSVGPWVSWKSNGRCNPLLGSSSLSSRANCIRSRADGGVLEHGSRLACSQLAAGNDGPGAIRDARFLWFADSYVGKGLGFLHGTSGNCARPSPPGSLCETVDRPSKSVVPRGASRAAVRYGYQARDGDRRPTHTPVQGGRRHQGWSDRVDRLDQRLRGGEGRGAAKPHAAHRYS